MSWPTPQEYNEAIQAPRLNFNDPELKAGSVELTPLGLPRAISGGFASVYRVQCSNREWAVRCFLREFSDQHQRYSAISKHLIEARLPYTVGFEFLPEGIRVGGKWYPILKMEWVQGELLHRYIKKNLNNSTALLNLANQWAKMIKALQAAGIAHGDLQHGNVLIANGEFRLIDYDGMYVPALSGQSSHEVGHRNYQHPQRTEFDFGPTVDNFASWVIYVSILALTLDPKLWDQVKAGDEYLLFRREDFQDPYISATLSALTNHSDERIYNLAGFFQSLLYSNPSQVPTLDEKSILQIPAANLQTPVSATGSKSRPEWLDDHISGLAPKKSDNTNAGGAAWVIDFINSPAALNQRLTEVDVTKPRITLISFILLCGLLLGSYFVLPLVVVMVMGFMLTAIVVVLLRDFYRRDPVVLAMIELTQQEQYEDKQLGKLHKQIKVKEDRRNAVDLEEKTLLKKIDSQLPPVQNKEKSEVEQVKSQLNSKITAINNKRQLINRNEAEQLRRIQESIGAEISRSNRQIASIPGEDLMNYQKPCATCRSRL